MAEGIYLRIRQTGVKNTPLLLTDIDIGEGGGRRGGHIHHGTVKPGAVYIPVASDGYIDLYYDSTVALSYESGAIRTFITLGYITATIMVGADVASAVREWSGWANYADSASAPAPGPGVPQLIPGGVWTTVQNDGMGTRTDIRFLPSGVTRLYNPATQELDFDQIPVGRTGLVRTNFTFVPTVNNTAAQIRIRFNAFGGWTLTTHIPSFNNGAGIPYQQVSTFDLFFIESTYGGAQVQVYVENDTNLYNQGYYIKVD